MLTEIVCPNKLVFSEDIDFIILPGEEGDFGVFNEHSPIISNLRTGLIYIYENKKISKVFFVKRGVCEITPKKCIILTEEAEETKDIKLESDHSNNEFLKLKQAILKNKFYS